eukprot:1778940-Pyramimonas_sp.AAC.1
MICAQPRGVRTGRRIRRPLLSDASYTSPLSQGPRGDAVIVDVHATRKDGSGANIASHIAHLSQDGPSHSTGRLGRAGRGQDQTT